MPKIIRLVALADGTRDAYCGQWVVDADVDAMLLLTTRHPARARTFPTVADAMAYWSRESRLRPTRPDGKPNRPLTAYTVEVADAPAGP